MRSVFQGFVFVSLLLHPGLCFLGAWRGSATSAACRRLHSTTIDTQSRPVPKVPASAWRWPVVWPFPEEYMDIMSDSSKYNSSSFSAAQVAAFQNHIKFFMEPGSKLVEIGAQQDQAMVSAESFQGSTSYLSLAQTGWVSSGSLSGKLPFDDASVDTVVLSMGIEAFKSPREAFREIWRVLKYRGKCIICFAGVPNLLGMEPIKMWTTMTDEQKIWIAGSYYQYSAGNGWENIEGYDVLGASKEGEMVFEKEKNAALSAETAFVVQASKYEVPTIQNSGSVEDYFSRMMVVMQNVNAEAKTFNALRLAADYSNATTEIQRQNIIASTQRLDSIYAILSSVQDSVVPAPIKALLANQIVREWDDSPLRVASLRKGLGMDPADEYWIELGRNTASLLPKMKIQLLAEVVTSVGSNPRVSELPTLMGNVLEVLRKRFPDATEKDMQTYTTELVIGDYLNSKTTMERVLKFVNNDESISSGWSKFEIKQAELK